MIEKAIEEHLSPQESANDADAENEDEDEDEEESDFKNIRPRTISDSIKETLEEHLNPKEPPSRPDYTLIIVGITLAIGLWHLYISVNTGINTLNEF
jgi:vesicle coat complex subunit